MSLLNDIYNESPTKAKSRLKIIDNGIILMGIPQEFQLIVPGVILILAVYFDNLRKKNNG